MNSPELKDLHRLESEGGPLVLDPDLEPIEEDDLDEEEEEWEQEDEDEWEDWYEDDFDDEDY